MTATDSHDTGALKAALAASEARAAAAEAQIAALTLMIEKLRRALYGRRSERSERLLGQLELALDELTASATEDELAAEKAAAASTEVKGFVRRKPSRKPFPDHLPRERVVVPAPTACECCGSERLSKVGEDVTETLEVIPRRWKVVQTVREKFTCRSCEKISQPPAPFHTVPRGWAGPNLLAMILFEKYGQHQPLNRQRDRYAREGVDLSTSTLADQVGACAVALKPLHDLIAAHVLAASRLHGDDTPVPVRRERSVPLVAELEDWMRTERAALSRHAAVAKAMDYMLKRWDGFARFLDDGHICLTNNAAERALRPLCLGRRSWLFAGSDRGGVRAAVMYTLIGTAKLNDVDPQAWLADVLDRIADLPQTRLHEILPWNWKGEQQQALAA